MALVYTVIAGKFEDEGENIKFADDADSMDAALRMIQEQKLYAYPFCRVEVTGFKVALVAFFLLVAHSHPATAF